MFPAHSIIFAGGGTMGSVMPLVAVIEQIKETYPHIPLGWVGTWRGIERAFMARRVAYQPICNGKFRRYVSLRTVIDPVGIIFGFFQSLALLMYARPRMVVSAGGFVAVPLHWAAWVLRIPSFALQLDVPQSLANALIAPFVTRMCAVIPGGNMVKQGIAMPIRHALCALPGQMAERRAEAITRFGLRRRLPTLLILGGGTGARPLNRAIQNVAPLLLRQCNIIHVTGKRFEGKTQGVPGYFSVPFLDESLDSAYAASDIVVTRAGMGVLSECAHLKLPTVLVPYPNSPQVKNAAYLAARGAALLVPQDERMAQGILHACRSLLASHALRIQLSDHLASAVPTDDGSAVLETINSLQALSA